MEGEISPEELHALLDGGAPKDLRLVDCREEDEYEICRLEGAELIPLRLLPMEAPARLTDKAERIVVYCHHGVRSLYGCEMLRALGYTHVTNLTGGIDATGC